MFYVGPIHDIFTTDDYVITGGKDGKVHFLTVRIENVLTIDMGKVARSVADSQGKPLAHFDGKAPCIRAIYMSGSRLLIGTKVGLCAQSAFHSRSGLDSET